MRTIYLVHQYTYGVTRCILCRHVRTWQAEDIRTHRPRHASVYSVRRWAEQDGWTRNKRQQMICPDCSKKQSSSD